VSVFKNLSVNNHQYAFPLKKNIVCRALAAIVNVISLKWVQHKTKPKKTTNCIIKKEKAPLFHAYSCS
jgi:hypothetical protein